MIKLLKVAKPKFRNDHFQGGSHLRSGQPDSTRFNPIMRSGTGLVQSGRAVGTIYLGRFLPECFGHVQNIRLPIVYSSMVGKRSDSDRVKVG